MQYGVTHPATTSVAGSMVFSTATLVKLGINTNSAVTPALLASAIAIPKAFGEISATGTVVGSNGVGISSVSISGTDITVNLSVTMVDANYAVLLERADGASSCSFTTQVLSRTTTSFTFRGAYICTTNTTITAAPVYFAVIGKLA